PATCSAAAAVPQPEEPNAPVITGPSPSSKCASGCWPRHDETPSKPQPARGPGPTGLPPGSMVSCSTPTKSPSQRSGDDTRLPLHPHLDRRGEPAHLAALPTRTTRIVLQGAG